MRIVRSFLILSVVCYVVVMVLTGCVRLSKKDVATGTTTLEPSVMLKFADIPVPKGFKFLPADSYAFQSGNIRVGVLVYSGRATPEQLVAFYQDQMPIYNWNFLNVIEYGKRLINFDRENESCVVSIEPKLLNTRVIISLGPKQQIPKKSEKAVK